MIIQNHFSLSNRALEVILNRLKENSIFFFGILVIAFIFVYTRWPALTIENSYKGWNSDHAIFVMMGEDILQGRDFPFFYWGGNYLGPLNNMAFAFVQKVWEFFGNQHNLYLTPSKSFIISPLVASYTCMTLFFLGTIFFGLAFKKIHSVWESLISCLLLSLGGALFMRTTLRPLGPEVAYLLGGIILWRGIHLVRNPNNLNQFIFGFLFGFSWRMNQITVFILAPIILYFISNTDEYKLIRNQFQLQDRFFLRLRKLHLREIPKFLKAFLSFVHILASINFIMGLVIAILGGVNTRFYGIKLKIHNGFSPMKTSILIFLGIQFFLWLFRSENGKEKVKFIISKVKIFLLGISIGYGPVILGRILGLYETGYKPAFIFVPILDLIPYWKKLILDFYPRLVIESTWYLALPFFILLLSSIFIQIQKNINLFKNYILFQSVKFPKESIVWAIPFFNLIYIFLCDRAKNQYAFRYAILSLPILFFYCTTCWRYHTKKKAHGLIVSSILISTLAFSQYNQGKKQLNDIITSPSLKKKLEILYKSECELFYSNYWNTYLFEYFLQHEKRFAVVRGQDRTTKKTALLRKSHLKKCDLNEYTFEIKAL